ncbi:hypothetical protein HDU87_000746 [Geranomyces variabilis]|uniref:Uncharacterized protein n=1 Tax=Geranomyces variabilis TaxID=109894 RepID=A0AAD5TN63_9FUNG|nr:hypothetical protein HDU87_000746 [Geranomyces variabilis]
MTEPSLEPAIRAFAAHPIYLALPTAVGEDAPDLETTSLLNPAFANAAAFEEFSVRNPAACAQLMSSLAVPLRRSVRSFLVPTGTSVAGQRLAVAGDVDQAKYTLLESFTTLRKRQEAEFAIREVKQGIVAFQEGNNTRALAKYKAALNHDPECTEAFVARGALYAKAEKYESAIADFDRALELDPTHNNAASYRRMTCKKLAEVEREKESARNGEFLMPLDYDPRRAPPPTTVSVSPFGARPVVPRVGFSSSVASSLGAPTPAGSIGDGDDHDADGDGDSDRRSRPRAPLRRDKRQSMGSPPPPRKKKKKSVKDKKSRKRSARDASSDSYSSSARGDNGR